MSNTVRLATVALALATLAPSAEAQTSRARWQGWLGCWTAAPAGAPYGSAQFAAPIVCIVPTSSADAVDVVTLAEGKVASTDRIDASGAPVPLDVKGCTGTKSGRWARDERRVFLKSEMTCDGVVTRATSILSMTPEGEWLDIRGVTSGGGGNVSTARYREVGIPSTLSAEMATTLRNVPASSQGARLNAGATFGSTAVKEATTLADSAVVEAWILEQGQRFALNARELIALADAGVSAKVTDAMVAVSNPDAFTVSRDSRRADENEGMLSRGRRIPVYLDPYNYPWSYGYSRYGSGYGYGYGYPGYYGRNYGGFYGGPPIIVVQGDGSGGNGQMVKGRGYQQNNPSASSNRSGSDRSRTSTSSSGSSNSGSSTSASPSTGSTQSAPASSGRTAKPRDP